MWSAVYVAAFSSPPSSSVVYQSSSPLHTSWQFYIFLYVVLPFPLCCSADCPARKKKKRAEWQPWRAERAEVWVRAHWKAGHTLTFSPFGRSRTLMGNVALCVCPSLLQAALTILMALEPFSRHGRKLRLKATVGK